MQKCAGETTSDITILRNEMRKKKPNKKRHSQGFTNEKHMLLIVKMLLLKK